MAEMQARKPTFELLMVAIGRKTMIDCPVEGCGSTLPDTSTLCFMPLGITPCPTPAVRSAGPAPPRPRCLSFRIGS